MLYFARHGHKLMGLSLTVLWDKLHVGDTEHPSKICSTVAFSANYRKSVGSTTYDISQRDIWCNENVQIKPNNHVIK